jgi:cell division septal protein FtsQ
MKLNVKRPTHRRSETRGGRNRPNGSRLYATVPLKRVARRIGLPALGIQRSAALAASLLLAVMLAALFVMPDYAVSDIVIKGNLGTPTQDIQAAVGFAHGYNAFLLRSRDVAAAVLALAGVEKADVRIILPGRLEISVKDVRPEVIWQTASQTLWVDSKGIVRDQPAVEPERKLTIKDVSGRVYNKGDQVDKAALTGAQQLGVLLARELQGFEFQRDGELTVVSNQGWRALFNTRQNLEKQVNALRWTLNRVQGLTSLDVRVPDSIVYSR